MYVRSWGLATAGILVFVGILWTGWWWVRQAPGTSDLLDVRLDVPGASSVRAREGAPNVVLVIGCTVRQDQTSIYGGPPTTTPFLSELAARGVLFTDPIAAAPWTKAASTALLTGHHAVSVGMTEPGGGRNERVLPERLDTLAERFRQGGWATAGVTLNPNLSATYGFDQGFDVYVQSTALWRDDPVKLSAHYAIDALPEVLGKLEEGRPRFLQLVLVDTHAPVQFTARDYAPFAGDPVARNLREYRAGLRQLDRLLGQLRRTLERHGMTETNTLFVFTNDHGEGLGVPPHHGKAHGRFLAPSSVGGVWVLQGAGIAEGHVVRGVASQVDVPVTLLALAGLPGLGGPGRDLSDQVRGEASHTDREMAFTDTWFREERRSAVYRTDRACQAAFAPASAKGGGFVSGCFDRRADPDHLRPIEDEALSEVLRVWHHGAVATGAAFGAAAIAVPGPTLESQLEALGYIDAEP